MTEIELTDELKTLGRAAREAGAAARKREYSAEAWRPWLDASLAMQSAVAAHARATGQSRVDVEMAVKQAAATA